jgi:hypothetical protein
MNWSIEIPDAHPEVPLAQFFPPQKPPSFPGRPVSSAAIPV